MEEKEAIFSVGFGDADGAIIFWGSGRFNVRLLPTALSTEGVQNAQGWQLPTQYLYDSYDPDNRRREVTFITEAGGNLIRPYIQKYWDRVQDLQEMPAQTISRDQICRRTIDLCRSKLMIWGTMIISS